MAERGLIYARASRDPQGGGTSVDKQIERGRSVAERDRVEVVEEVRDNNRSASRGAKSRPGFARVRSLIERSAVDVLILWEVSRSSRDLEEFMSLVNLCADQGVALSVSGTRYDPGSVDDWLPLVLQGVMAEAEARRIRKRNLDSVETNAQRGTPHGRIPYGYRRIYDPRTGVLINQTPYVQVDGSGEPIRDANGEVVPVLPDAGVPMALSAEAQVLHDAVHAVLGGTTIRQVVRDLNDAGVPTPRVPRAKTVEEEPEAVVKQWEAATLRQLLRNPTIAGRRKHRGVDIGPAAWPPIVDYGVWLRLEALLSDPARLTVAVPRGPAPRHLLSKIARCGECGGRVKASLNSASRNPRTYVCRIEGCMQVSATASHVDERVEAAVLALLSRPDNRARLTEAQQRREQAAADAPDVATLIARKEAELAEVEKMRERDEMTVRAFAFETKRLERAIEELKGQQVAHVESPALRRLLTADDVAAAWAAADLMERREVVRLLLEVTIKRASIPGRRFDASRVVIAPGVLLRSEAPVGK